MKTRRYLHIGCPKAVSTTLQRDFFGAHPALRHLGVGCGGNVDYRDADLELAVEGHFMFCRELRYREKREGARALFAEHFAAAEAETGIEAVGLSNESLCFGYTPGHVDTAEKARRLHDVFGPETAVILIVRQQASLLRSLHRESIRNGFAGTLSDFLHFAYLHQDRSFLYDFQFDRTVECYAELFGRRNVHVLPLENFLQDGQLIAAGGGHTTLTDHLAGLLGVEPLPLILGHHNSPLSEAVLEAKRQLNGGQSHDLGHPQLAGVVNGHRLRQVYARDLEWESADWLYDDVKCKRALIAQATEQAAVAPEALDTSVPPQLRERLNAMFAASNARLKSMLDTDLPADYFDPQF